MSTEDPNQQQEPSPEQQPYGQPPPGYYGQQQQPYGQPPPQYYGQQQYDQPPPYYGRQQQQYEQPPSQYGQPFYGQAPQYGQPFYSQPALEYVSVGLRFLAVLIDGLIIGVLTGFLSFPFRDAPGFWGGSVGLLAILYYTVMEATQGATFGKMALGLRVVKLDGSPISWDASIIRN